MNQDQLREAFEVWADNTQPAYWRTTAWARDAWLIWSAALTATQQAAPSQGAGELNPMALNERRYIAKRKAVFLSRQRLQVSGHKQTEDEFNSEYDEVCDKHLRGLVADHRGVFVENKAMIESAALLQASAQREQPAASKLEPQAQAGEPEEAPCLFTNMGIGKLPAFPSVQENASCCAHASDCAVHNAPALPSGPCDCDVDGDEARDTKERSMVVAYICHNPNKTHKSLWWDKNQAVHLNEGHKFTDLITLQSHREAMEVQRKSYTKAFRKELKEFRQQWVEAIANKDAALKVDSSSRSMFVARLEAMSSNGDKRLTVEAVLALLNDCDMLASLEVGAAITQGQEAMK